MYLWSFLAQRGKSQICNISELLNKLGISTKNGLGNLLYQLLKGSNYILIWKFYKSYKILPVY